MIEKRNEDSRNTITRLDEQYWEEMLERFDNNKE